jgi:outer membrane receptor for ferrienterochelin and colicin
MYSSFTRGPYLIYGNPNLNPETSKTYELATGYAISDLTLDLVYHHTKFDNLINSYTVVGFPFPEVSYQNVAKATIEGVELSTTYHPIDTLGINASLEYLDTKDDTTGERLADSARYTAKVRLSYEYVDTNYFLNFKSLRDYKGTIEGTRDYDEGINYHVIDLKVTHALSDTLEFSAGIDNIQNNKMEYGMALFGTPNDPGERYYYVGATVKF